MINLKLAEEQGLSDLEITRIEEIHSELNSICSNPGQYIDPVSEIEAKEYELQELWGFDQDPAYHTWWLRIIGCECPKMDNSDTMYFGKRIINSRCKWHSIKTKEGK